MQLQTNAKKNARNRQNHNIMNFHVNKLLKTALTTLQPGDLQNRQQEKFYAV